MEEENKHKPPTHDIQWKITRIHKPPFQKLPAVTIFRMGRIWYNVMADACVELRCGKEFIEAVPDLDWKAPMPIAPMERSSSERVKPKRRRGR